jgi:hypothetical protein
MTSGDFEHRNQERWAEYERLVGSLEKGRKEPAAGEMPRRFREICADLSLAESRMYGARITERLNALVIRGQDRGRHVNRMRKKPKAAKRIIKHEQALKSKDSTFPPRQGRPRNRSAH